MAKIYETLDDLNRDAISKKGKCAEASANECFTKAPLYLMIAGLGRMLRQAQSTMGTIPQSNLWKFFGSEKSVTFKVAEWGGLGLTCLTTIGGLVYKYEQKQAKNELDKLGNSQKIIVKSPNGDHMDIIVENGSCKKIQQASPVIHCDGSQVDYLQEPTNTVLKSL